MTRYEAPTASQALPYILSDLLEHGLEVGSRNGRVKEFLNTTIMIRDPQHREILAVNRKANVFAQIAETMWVLAGRNDIEWLSAYLPRAKDYSDDGETWRGGYGPRLRGGHFGFDQLAHVVDLLAADPLSRRAVVAIYEPQTDASPGKDIPCNDFLQFQSRNGALHLTVTVRSNDVMWGWSGINAFEWSVVQEIVAHLLGITVGTLTFNIGSLHLYDRHWNKASRIEYVDFHHPIVPFQLPEGRDRTLEEVDLLIDRWFAWEACCRHGKVTPDMLDEFEEPLFRSWAAAIAYFWTREDWWLPALRGTALAVAVAQTPVSVFPEAPEASQDAPVGQGHPLHLHERVRAFYDFATDLHAVKDASYGDSWKKRGEKMSILANMARKVDRLGVGDKFDSSSDTVTDLLIYAVKYELWLNNLEANPKNVNSRLADYLAKTEHLDTEGEALDITFADVASDFDKFVDEMDGLKNVQKWEFASELALRLAPIARDLWYAETHPLDSIDEYRGADAD